MISKFYKILGTFLISYLIFSRLFRIRLPKDLYQLNFYFILSLTIIYLFCFILLFHKIIKKKYYPLKERHEIYNIFNTTIIKPFNDIIEKSYQSIDYFIKDDLLGANILGKSLKTIMNFLLNKIGIHYYAYKVIFIICDILPKIILLIIFFVDVVIFNQLKLIYLFAWLALIPILFNYIVFTFREFSEYNIKGILEEYIIIKTTDLQDFLDDKDIVNECCCLYREDIFALCSQEYLDRTYAAPLQSGRVYILNEDFVNKHSNDKLINELFDEIISLLNNYLMLRQIIYEIETVKYFWKYLYFAFFRIFIYTLLWSYILNKYPFDLSNKLLLSLMLYEDPFSHISLQEYTPNSVLNLKNTSFIDTPLDENL